jgi:hypothetical protein
VKEESVRLRHRSDKGYRHGGEAGGELSEIGDEVDIFRMRKRSLRVHGLEDTGDVKVRAKMVAGTALVRLKRNIFRVFWGFARGKASNRMISRFVFLVNYL